MVGTQINTAGRSPEHTSVFDEIDDGVRNRMSSVLLRAPIERKLNQGE